ncbi:MAG: HAMP domain-containing sensor histidine kinase [Armatimonadota bacterium]
MNDFIKDNTVILNDEYYLKLFHDLRSGLTIMGGYSSILLEEEGSFTEDERIYIDKINEGYKSTLELLNDATDLIITKRLAGFLDKKEMELKGVIEKAKDEAKSILKEKNITLEESTSQDPLPVKGEEELLYKAFYHALKQLVLFSPRDAVIKLNTALKEGKISVSLNCAGAVIPEEEIPSLFEPFLAAEFLTPFGKKKIGLDMTIVREIMTLYNGSIEAVMKSGEGFTINMEMPV